MAQPVLYRAHRIKRLLDAIVVAPVDVLVDQREHLPTGALPNSNSPTLRCSASTSPSSPGSRHATASTAPRRPARGIPVPGRQRGHAALAIRLDDPKWATAPTLSRAAGRLASAACRPIPVRSPSARFPGDDGAPHTPSVTGILRQPAFQSLPGRITEMFDHFGGRH